MPTTRDLDAELDERLQRFAASGMSRAGMLAQLNLAGYPTNKLRERFPEMSDVAFGIATPDQRPRPTGQGSDLQQPNPCWQTSRAKPRLRGRLRRRGPQDRPPCLQLATPASREMAAATRNVAAAEEGGGISFHYVPLIQCSFPHADPGESHSFTRKNGWLELTLGTTRPETGLPYGVPARLLTIYAASEAVRTKSPEIFLGTSVHDFLRRLDVPITRGDRGSLRVYANQLLKLIHCTLTIDENIKDASGRTGLHIRQALFAEEARLWWDDARGVGQGSLAGALERAVPLDPRSLGAALDQRDQVAAQEPDGPRRLRLARASALSPVEAEHGHLAAALRAVRPRLLGAAPLPPLLHRLAEARARGLPRSEAQGRRRRRDPAAVATAHRTRAQQGLSVTSVTPITCAIRARIANLSGIRAFASARIRPEEGTLHLSRPIAQPTVFKSILMNWRGQRRAPTRYICHAKPLHLSRPSVASVTQKRCISPTKCLFHL